MMISHKDKIEGQRYEGNGAKGVLRKVLIGATEGWSDYVMRLFEVEVGGHSPKHSHPWPHIVYVLSGAGNLYFDGQNQELKGGSFVYVAENKEHQFINKGSEKLSFICIVPPEGN